MVAAGDNDDTLHNTRPLICGEDVKVVQELLRHGSARITMDVYAQAVTPAKRKAQEKLVSILRDGDKQRS